MQIKFVTKTCTKNATKVVTNKNILMNKINVWLKKCDKNCGTKNNCDKKIRQKIIVTKKFRKNKNWWQKIRWKN